MIRNLRTRVALLMFTAPILGANHLLAQSQVAISLERIRDEGLQRSRVMETLTWLTDVFGGRLTGSPAIVAAADWTERRLQEWRIPVVYRECWLPLWPSWTNELLWVRVVQPHAFSVIAINAPWTASTRGVVRGPAVVASDITTDADFERYRGKLRNAFVMLAVPPRPEAPLFEPLASRLTNEELRELMSPDTSVGLLETPAQAATRARMRRLRAELRAFDKRRLKFLAEEGAVAVVNVGEGTGGTVFASFLGLEWPDPWDSSPLPVLTFAQEHYGRIARVLEKGVPVILEADVRNTVGPSPDSSFNLLAEIRGSTQPDEVVMIGAHFDSYHFAPGATDNAANVATMMEAIRILHATRVPLRRTVRLALWTGEEQGLYGSRAYVHRHFVDSVSHKPRSAAAKLAAYYNLDHGAGAIRGIYLDLRIQRSMKTDSTFRAWAALLDPELGFSVVSARGTGGTDHVSFHTTGLPGFQFVQDWLEYFTRTHHSNMDTFERVVPEDLKRNAVIIASWAYLTANSDAVLPRVRPAQR